MAGFNQMFGQLKGKAENLTTRITENSALEKDGVTLKALKQRKASLIQEKQKYFGYLGMAVYEMHKEQGLEFKEFSMDLEKLAEFDKEITDLNQQIEAKEQERIQSVKNVCVNCGAKLEGKARFCAKCGTPVKSDSIICHCGETVMRTDKFCPGCGTSVEDLLEEEKRAVLLTNEAETKTCICGAKVEAGQFMCMECGRKL